MQVWSPGQKDPLEEGMTPDSSILAWRIPWTEEPGGLQSVGSQRAGHDLATEHEQETLIRGKSSIHYLTHMDLCIRTCEVLGTKMCLGWPVLSMGSVFQQVASELVAATMLKDVISKDCGLGVPGCLMMGL